MSVENQDNFVKCLQFQFITLLSFLANVLCLFAFCSAVLSGGSAGCCFSLSHHCHHVFYHPHRCMEKGKMGSLNQFRFSS